MLPFQVVDLIQYVLAKIVMLMSLLYMQPNHSFSIEYV